MFAQMPSTYYWKDCLKLCFVEFFILMNFRKRFTFRGKIVFLLNTSENMCNFNNILG